MPLDTAEPTEPITCPKCGDHTHRNEALECWVCPACERAIIDRYEKAEADRGYSDWIDRCGYGR
jgi:ribosomal protein L37AE/L43A